ncbi:60S ribosomal export protein NMD3 [Methanobrevibacter sp. DSM 116169]|uniref:60S ribosomal export protein NMD3 n=1 Tax=Methanobrevibacter sp. DSM 116169 TaxID=3242727 RepID=UPI0038FCADBA
MFCPECGSTQNQMIDDICIECFLKDFHMITIPERIEVTICSHCNSKIIQGKWKDSEIPIEEIIYRALEENIQVNDLVKDEIIDLDIIKMRGSIAECDIHVEGDVLNHHLEEDFEAIVKINKTVCPPCSKRNSGYYEVVIQFRADNRELTIDELLKADEIVINTLGNLQSKDKLAYLAEIAKPKEGHDYYIGSYKSGKKVVKALQEQFGGLTKESPRLISEDKSTGKGLYRIWISFRIPKFQVNDFIKFENKLSQVKSIGSSKIQCIDITNKKSFTIPFKDYDNIDLVKKFKDIEKANIISKSPKMIQILDPETYEVIDLNLEDTHKYNIGDDVNIIKIENQVYLI